MAAIRSPRYGFLILVALIVVVLALAAVTGEVCRDWGFICKNTASRKGYREWFFGLRSGAWYTESALERFMREHYPNELQHNWVSYNGTGENIFGRAMSFGHGRPGAIISLQDDMLTLYCERVDDVEKKALYDLFASGDNPAILAAIEAMLKELMKQSK